MTGQEETPGVDCGHYNSMCGPPRTRCEIANIFDTIHLNARLENRRPGTQVTFHAALAEMELSGADQMMTITETGECELNGFMSCICYFIYYYNTEANELVSKIW